MKRCLFLCVALVSSAPVLAADDGFKTARAMVMAAHPGECESDIAERFEKLEGDVFEVSWPYKRYDGTVETLKGRLYEITCGVGAYNISVAYVFARENGFPEEGEIVAFAAPSYSLEYEKDDDTYTKLASDPAVTGLRG